MQKLFIQERSRARFSALLGFSLIFLIPGQRILEHWMPDAIWLKLGLGILIGLCLALVIMVNLIDGA